MRRRLLAALAAFALAASVVTAEPPALTPYEQLALEHAALRQQLAAVLAEQGQWRTLFAECAAALHASDSRALVEANRAWLQQTLDRIHAARPGYRLDLATGHFIPTPE